MKNRSDRRQLPLAHSGKTVVICHRVAGAQKMPAALVKKERQILLRDQMQRAAQCPGLYSALAQCILIRDAAAAQTQRVQTVAVKLRLQPAERAQHLRFASGRGKKPLFCQAYGADLVDLQSFYP